VRAARDATSVLPIVAIDLETDPVASGFARSLGRPGGNITGLFLDLPGLAGKWLELLRAAVPKIQNVGVLWDSGTGSAQLAAVKAAALALAVTLQVLEVRNADDIDTALGAGLNMGAKALVMLSSPLTSVRVYSNRIVEFAASNRLPAVSPFRIFAEAGGLMSYGPDQAEYYRRVAPLVDKILKGARPSDLPIELPNKFELVINMKTAKALRLTMPQSLLLRADEVIR
jgi:putative ABC transport system substrate-binding protein